VGRVGSERPRVCSSMPMMNLNLRNRDFSLPKYTPHAST
jgi:hypothetical protein